MLHSPTTASSPGDLAFSSLQLADKTVITIQSPGKAVVRIVQEGDTMVTIHGGGDDSGSDRRTIIRTDGDNQNYAQLPASSSSTINSNSLRRHTPMTSKQDFIVPRINKKQPQRTLEDANSAASDKEEEESEDDSDAPPPPPPPEEEEENNPPVVVRAQALITTDELPSGLPITSTTHAHEFTDKLDKEHAVRDANTFCLQWQTNSDEWWTHHPGWEMGNENATHYCFSKIVNDEKKKLFQDIYQVQFHGDCSKTHTKRMWNSGWSADLTNIIDGLKHVVIAKIPVQVVEKPWHYADPASAKPTKDNRQVPPACPRGNMFCYFLPLSACPPAPEGDKSQFLQDNTKRGKKGKQQHQWYYEYLTRRQTWLRKAVFDFRQKQKIHGPCTAIHCRRGDVVLHTGMHKRRYHPIAEYMNATQNLRPNIYLMTDDANAIVEAQTEFPNYNWMYIDRPRYKANEGGWEKQIPSNDPTLEVVVLLAAFQMVRQCDQLIHSRSGFATQLYSEMMATGHEIDRIDLDKGGKVFSTKYKDSVHISAAYDTDKQQQEQQEAAAAAAATE